MIGRISTAMFYQSSLSSIRESFGMVGKYQNQISSGVRVSVGAEDPVAISRRDRLDAEIKEINRFSKIQDVLEMKWIDEENDFSSLVDLGRNMIEAIGGMAHPVRTAGERSIFASQVSGWANDVWSLANKKDVEGRYVFGGTMAFTAPFGESGGVVIYSGSSYSNRVMLGDYFDGEERKPGQDVFILPSENGNKVALMDRMKEIISWASNPPQTLSSDDYQILEGWRKDFEAWTNGWIDMRAEVGVKLSRMDDIRSEQGKLKLNLI